MRLRLVFSMLVAVTLTMGGRASAQGRPSLGRPDVFDIGAPRVITCDVLHREMLRIMELAEFIHHYGYPDYAEIQAISVKEPFAPYEVRVYYLARNQVLAFGHVYVAPDATRYGIKKYGGPIPSDTLARLLASASESGCRTAKFRLAEWE